MSEPSNGVEAVTEAHTRVKLEEIKSWQGWLNWAPEPWPDVITSSSQPRWLPSWGSNLKFTACGGSHFQIAAHTGSSRLLLGRTVWGAWLCHVTWGTVAAIGALCVLTVTVCTECCRPVQVFTLIHIYGSKKESCTGLWVPQATSPFPGFDTQRPPHPTSLPHQTAPNKAT